MPSPQARPHPVEPVAPARLALPAKSQSPISLYLQAAGRWAVQTEAG